MQAEKILVTGGAGYIGSHTIIELIEKGYNSIISIDNFVNSTEEAFTRIHGITTKKIKNHAIDLCNAAELEKLFVEEKKINSIIHFAALKSVPESMEKPDLYFQNNMESLKNILYCASKYNVRSFIFSSSCSVYGDINTLPVNETTPLNKTQSPYAETKLLGEKMVESFAKENKEIKCVALRYFNPVGAHISGKIGESPINPPSALVPVITKYTKNNKQITVHGNDYPTRDGTCIRDYIHVSDIANAHVKALEFLANANNKTDYELFNLGSGNGITVLEMISAFEKTTGVKVNYQIGERRTGDVMAIYSNSAKANDLLKWEPKFTVDEMMETAWKWENHS
jgi:UDP-glucose 4-epimerase